MKKVLGLILCAGLAITAVPSYADFTNNTGVYVAALYTKPSNNGLDIGQNLALPTSRNASSFPISDRALFLSPKYNWDYSLGISYHFNCTDTRAFVEYDHFHDKRERQADGIAALLSLPSPIQTGILNTEVSAHVHEHLNAFRFGLKHFLPFGDQFYVDLAGYFEYNKLNRAYHAWNKLTQKAFSEVTPIITPQLYAEVNNSVHGWGPGVGFRLTGIPFRCWTDFRLFAGTMATVFYGTNLYTANQTSLPSDLGLNLSDFSYYFEPESSKSLIVKFDVNMGMDYYRVVNLGGCNVQAGLTLGVRYLNILNAFKNGNIAPLSYSLSSSGSRALFFPEMGVSDDWGRVGPYLQFRIGGADA